MNSPYLEAIQKIPGLTPGEKYKTLNEKARAIITSTTNEIDPLDSINSFDIPEPLVPLVRVEISKILRKPDGIIEALKSGDSLVFERALTAKWFFDGTNETTNVHYYNNNIFPYISLNNRVKIIKNLALQFSSHPERSTIAEEFFEILSINYGEELAKPLLIACSEPFLRKMIIDERRIDPSLRSIKIIYQKYPKVIIDYLKLIKPEKPYERGLHKMSIRNYVHFLPKLVKNNVKDFIELIELHKQSFRIRFSKTRGQLFIKNGIYAIVRNPDLFLPMVSLKQVTNKLTAAQFKMMFKNLLPPKIENFRSSILEYLKFYPENEKIDVLLSSFEEVYGKSLLEEQDRLSTAIFKLLPVEERIRQARKRLEENDSCPNAGWNLHKCWRSYLPTAESIPAIKEEISKTSNDYSRSRLLEEMMFTCWMNNDLDALLETLKYIWERHENETSKNLSMVLSGFLAYFGDVMLTVEHWEVLNKLIQWIFVKDEYHQYANIFRNLIIEGIYFNLQNKFPISEMMDVFIEVTARWVLDWNILKGHPEYERMCLDYVLERIPQKYSVKSKIGHTDWQKIVITLIESINEFNKRNLKNPKTNLENICLRNYQLLLDAVKKILGNKKEEQYVRYKLATALQDADAEIYEDYVLEKDRHLILDDYVLEKGTGFNANEAVILLKKEPQKIKEKWEKYLSGCTEEILYRAANRRFVKNCRWHQDLPIKFAEKSLDNFLNKKEGRSLIVLALLYEGSSIERVVAPFLQEDFTRNMNAADEARMQYIIEKTITAAFRLVEPPISVDLFFDFCQGDRLHTALATLVNFCRRSPLPKVIQFAMKLMDKPVSMQKQGIRMFYLVSTVKEIRQISMHLLRNEKHRSIRSIVLDKMMQLFVNKPNEETWEMVQEAIGDLKPDDDALATFMKSDKVAKEFINEYLKLLLETIRRLATMEEGLSESDAAIKYHTIFGAAVDATSYLSEEFHEYLLQEYFNNLGITDYLLADGIRRYVIYGYLIPAGDKFERRLEHLMNLLRALIENHWDVMDPERPGCLPGNYMLHMFIEYIIKRTQFDATTKKIMEAIYMTVFSILKPQQMPTSYLYLTYIGLVWSTTNSREFAGKIREVLPSMIEALAGESISLIANTLYDFLSSILKIEDMVLDVVEGLLEIGDDCSAILASTILSCRSEATSDERFWRIIEVLKRYTYPVIVSNVYMSVNRLPMKEKKQLTLTN